MAASFPPFSLPSGLTESYIQSHDLNYHVLSAGQPKKPLVLCLHGFPEIAYSWRKIMPAIADEGYHVVAYDQRGYGRTTGWDTGDFHNVDLNTFRYTLLVRDAIVLANALGYKEVACVLGHDFGAAAASMCAVMRPDFFKSVVIMSRPFSGIPALPFDIVSNPQPSPHREDIHKALAELPQPRKHYQAYYSTASAAEDMGQPQEGLHSFLRGYFHLKSADWKGNNPKPLKAREATELAKMPYYYIMPLTSTMRDAVKISMADENAAEVTKQSARWLDDNELDVYVQEFGRNGFQGSLNWYRVSTDARSMQDIELFSGRNIDIPSLFIAGDKDWGTYQAPGAVEKMSEACTQLKGVVLVEGAGHWVQQEQPEQVIGLVSKFLRDIKKDAISH